MMKRLLALVAGIVAGALLAAGAAWLGGWTPGRVPSGPADGDAQATSASSARAGPKLALEETTYDFGTMETDGAGRHAFAVANRGDQPLVLARQKTSCGCCTCECDAELPDGGRIAPGESAAVGLFWKIKRYTGAFRQSVTLTTNDPDRPEVTLAATGRVTPTVRVVPAQLVFTQVPSGEPATGEIRLYGYRSRPLEITGHEFSDPSTANDIEIACERLPPDEVAAEKDARSGCLLRVKVRPRLAASPFRQHVVLKTNVEAAANVEVYVQGTVGSELIVAGFGWEDRTGILTLGTISAAKGTERKLLVIARGPHAKEVKLKPVRTVPDLLKVEIGPSSPVGDGAVQRIPLVLRIPPGSPQANHLGSRADELGQIVLQTGHPKQPELRILVRFAVKADAPP